MRSWMIRACVVAAISLFVVQGAVAQSVRVSPFDMTFRTTAGEFWPTFKGLIVTSEGNSEVPWRYVGMVSGDCSDCGDEPPPNFILVSPSAGQTPQQIVVALNPNVVPYLAPQYYQIRLGFTREGQTCPGSCAMLTVNLTVVPQPSPPVITAVRNAASLSSGAVAPGELVSIFGEHLGTPPISSQFDSGGVYPTELGNTKVTFDGIPGALFYVSPNQVNTMVPYAVAGRSNIEVVVTHGSKSSAAFAVPVTDVSPGVFTANSAGSGQGAILNQDYSHNHSGNPAAKGTVVSLFATGAGLWKRLSIPEAPHTFQEYAIFIAAGSHVVPVKPVSVTIGGQAARVQYAGPAPYQVSGMLQVNVWVPEGVSPGEQPVVLTVGDKSNEQQRLTMAVK